MFKEMTNASLLSEKNLWEHETTLTKVIILWWQLWDPVTLINCQGLPKVDNIMYYSIHNQLQCIVQCPQSVQYFEPLTKQKLKKYILKIKISCEVTMFSEFKCSFKRYVTPFCSTKMHSCKQKPQIICKLHT